MRKEKTEEETKLQEIVRRFENALGMTPIQEAVPNEFLDIENAKSGLKINLWSAKQDMDSLFKLSLKIKKEFFNE